MGVHINVLSRPQVYLNPTLDVNGSNFTLSGLFCDHPNVFCSKALEQGHLEYTPNTLKCSIDHLYELAYAQWKHIPEIKRRWNTLYGGKRVQDSTQT